MRCAEFQAWLDEGLPAEGAPRAREHAGCCTRCAAALVAAESLEALLAARVAVAPPALADRVMERIAAEPVAGAPLWVLWPEPELPWWVRLVCQPSVWLSLLLVALVIAWGDRLAAAATGLVRGTAVQITGLTAVAGGPVTTPAVALPLVIAMGLVSLGLYRLFSGGARGAS